MDASSALAFDALRGAAAVTVVLGHASFFWLDDVDASRWPGLAGALPRAAGVLLRAADLAVIAFFVVSGAVVGASLLRRAAAPGGFDARAFAVARVRRLLPPLLAAYALMLAVWAALLHGNAGYAHYWSWSEALAGLAFVQDLGFGVTSPPLNGPLWSLSHEAWFYAAGALATAALVTRRALFWVFPAALGAWAWAGDVPARWVLGLACWAGGAVAAFALTARPHRRLGHPLLRTRAPAALAAGACAASGLVHLAGTGPWAARYACGAAFGAWLTLTAVRRGRIDPGTGALVRAAAVVGAGSYTLYLVHYPLVLLANVLAEGPQTHPATAAAMLLGGTAALTALALALARLVEPGRRRTPRASPP